VGVAPWEWRVESRIYAQRDECMKHLLISILLLFWFSGHIAFAQEVRVDSGLLKDIASGHQLLSRHVETLSGRMECVWSSSSLEKHETSTCRQFMFFRDKDLLRLEYIHPMEDAKVFPGHEKNDITEVSVISKEHDFHYIVIPSTGVPYANLHKSTGANEALRITLAGDFYSNVDALVAVDGATGAKIVDLLQDKIGSVETRQYNDVPDAMWIKSPKSVDESGTDSGWTVILNPKQHYALLFCEIRVENLKNGFSVICSKTVSSQVADDGKILPKEIVSKGQTKALVSGQKQELNTSSYALVSILSTDKPDGRLFTEESFKDMGRDYAVVDMLPNQQLAQTGSLVLAAPLESRVPSYPIEEYAKSEWTWTRIILLSAGIILTVWGGVRLYFRWRRS